MPETMLAVCKTKSDAGLEVREVPRPRPGPEDVLVYVEAGSVEREPSTGKTAMPPAKPR